jgi:hypothetical protein
MSRRKKDPKVPRSTAWEEYRPQDALYWKFGGPFIPPDEIEPEPYDASYTASHLKNPVKRTEYILSLVENYEKDLAEAIAYYGRLNELGIDALKFEWHREEDRKLDASPGDWTMVARDVDRHRESTYRTIRMRKGQIAAYRKLVAEIEADKFPLMFKREKKS